MLRPTRLALVVWAAAFAETPAPADGVAAGGTLIRQFLEATAARGVECPAGLDAYGTAQDAVCATTTRPPKIVKKELKALMRRRDDVVPTAGALWAAEHEYALARFFVDRELFVLRYDPRDGGLALMPHQSCFRPEALKSASVATVRDPGVTPPVATTTPAPDYPAAARVERRNGFAMVQVVVSPAGTVVDACVLYATPEGLGFREEALRSAALLRFRPGSRDGRPARVLVNQSLTWEIRRSLSE